MAENENNLIYENSKILGLMNIHKNRTFTIIGTVISNSIATLVLYQIVINLGNESLNY